MPIQEILLIVGWVLLFLSYFLLSFYFAFQQIKIKKKNKQTEEKLKTQILKSQFIVDQMIQEAEYNISLLKKTAENDLNERRIMISNLEGKIIYKEELLTSQMKFSKEKEESLCAREKEIKINQENIAKLQSKIEDIINQQQKELERITLLTFAQAKELLMQKVENVVYNEIMNYAKNKEEEYKAQIQQKAKVLLISTMQNLSRNIIPDQNISVIYMEKDDLKGRIIGKEGRNIRTFEIITGVDLIIDDVPNTVVLSCFDPIRREIAKRTLEYLIQDGRITPASIETVFQTKVDELDVFTQEIGQNAVYEAKIGQLDKELVYLLGKLHFRHSYGQNVLHHSLEVAFIAGKLAAEIGENETIARRAGLLHDIGKSLDYEMEGSHVEIGVNLASKYKEPLEVIDAIASHHENQENQTLTAVLVMIADSLSSARPGARKESVENYFKRVKQLEKIADSVPGIQKSYVIKAGREIRVIVKTEEINDLGIFIVAKQIKNKIEQNVNYNGNIKITVVRECRAIEVAEVNTNN